LEQYSVTHLGVRFFEIYDVSARTKGVEPVRTFYRQGKGQFFAILCGRLLWKAPYLFSLHCPFIVKPWCS